MKSVLRKVPMPSLPPSSDTDPDLPVEQAAARQKDPPGPGLHVVPQGNDDVDGPLVARAQRGDRVAFAQLFRRHHGRVAAMCGRLLASRAEAEDATQQTFLEAWRCLPRFEQRSRFTTWLTRIAILTCFSFRRRLKRLVLRGDDGGELPAALHVLGGAEGRPDALDVTAAHAREGAIGEVLMALGEKKRVVFVLAELEEMSSTEIAAILDIPDATVRTRLFHARREVAAAVRTHPGFADLLRARGAMRGEP